MVATAVSAVASVGGSLLSSKLSSNASNKAAKAQQNAAQTANSDVLQMYNQTRSDLAPYRASGTAANNQLSYLMGLTPGVDSAAAGQGFSAGSEPGSTSNVVSALPGNVVQAIRNFKSNSPNLMFPDGSDAMVEHTAAKIAGMTPDQYNAWLSSNGLSGVDQSVFSNALNPPPVTGSASNNGYGSTVNTGTGAFGSLTKPFTAADMQVDPGYQFRLSQGNTAINNAQAARGNLYSGAALKEADAYNSGQAAQQYNTAYDQYNTNQNNLYNRLAGISNSGFGATNAGVTSNTNAGNTLAGIAGQAGNAAANSAINTGNIYTQGISSLLGGGKSSYGSGGNSGVGAGTYLSNIFSTGNSSGIPDGGFSGATGIPFAY